MQEETITATTATFTSLPIFVAYLATGHSLTPFSVFVIFAYAKVLGLFTKYLCRRLAQFLDCNVSVSRILNFLATAEGSWFDTEKRHSKTKMDQGKNEHHNNPVISLTNALCKATNDKMLLENVSILTEGAQTVIITGPVGSGKTSLLLAILSELSISKGNITHKGKMAFVGQSPWVFSGTLRDNITFNKPFDSTKFQKTVEACALTTDITQFPDEDLTTTGEYGIVLSGGQRARVNMTRALYSDADIYLLDDPLSCVDAQVGNHIFENYVRTAISDRLCIFVTHQPCYMNYADHIIVMNEGSIAWEGSYTDLINKGPGGITGLEKVLKNEDGLNNCASYESVIRERRQLEKSGETSLIIPKEDRNFGSVSYQTYWKYFRAGLPVYLMVFLAVICNSALGECP